MFDSDNAQTHVRATLVASFIMWTYWIKEIMEYLLRVVYGVDRRMMYVPVPQNTRVDFPLLNNNPVFQRGDLFYFVYHSTVSVSLAGICYMMALYTPKPQPIMGFHLPGT